MKYMGKTPVNTGDTVELVCLDETWARAKVTQVLATMFLCRIGRGTERFFFYADKGLTWRHPQ